MLLKLLPNGYDVQQARKSIDLLKKKSADSGRRKVAGTERIGEYKLNKRPPAGNGLQGKILLVLSINDGLLTGQCSINRKFLFLTSVLRSRSSINRKHGVCWNIPQQKQTLRRQSLLYRESLYRRNYHLCEKGPSKQYSPIYSIGSTH
jgi:hypothetical protein